MDHLNFDAIETKDIIDALIQLGRTGVAKLARSDAIQQLRIAILAHPDHFREMGLIQQRRPWTLADLQHAVTRLDRRPINAVGIQTRRRPPLIAPFTMMGMLLDPTGFDDTLLTMVPMMTYRTHDIVRSLLPPRDPLFLDIQRNYYYPENEVTPAVQEAFDALQNMATIHFAGGVAPVPKNPPYTYEWVIDVGRSGTEYPRLMFTMPPLPGATEGGDVWTTMPFGLRDDHPLALLIGGQSMSDMFIVAHSLNDVYFTMRGPIGEQYQPTPPVDRHGVIRPQVMAFLSQHCGCQLPRKITKKTTLSEIPNLSQAFTALCREAFVELVRRIFPSYVMRRDDIITPVVTDIMRRNNITRLYDGSLSPILRIPPEAYDPMPIWDKYGLPAPTNEHFFDGANTDAGRLRRMLVAWNVLPIDPPISGTFYRYRPQLHTYFNALLPELALEMIANLQWKGGLGETKADARPYRILIRYEDAVQVAPQPLAQALGLQGSGFYTQDMLREVLRRGYKLPPLVTEEQIRVSDEFHALSDIQRTMLSAVMHAPVLTVPLLHELKLTHGLLWQLISQYSPAIVEEFIEQMPFLPPPNVNRREYVEQQLPLLIEVDGVFQTDAVLLAAAGMHIPYQRYEQIAPYFEAMKKASHFFIPFQRPSSAEGIFGVALGNATSSHWIPMGDLIKFQPVVGIPGAFTYPGITGPLYPPNMANLHALLFEAIDVLYYPDRATTYLQAIYKDFTHEDEELVDVFLERSMFVAPPPARRQLDFIANAAGGFGGLPLPPAFPGFAIFPAFPELAFFPVEQALPPRDHARNEQQVRDEMAERRAAQTMVDELTANPDGMATLRWLFNNPGENNNPALRAAVAMYGNAHRF